MYIVSSSPPISPMKIMSANEVLYLHSLYHHSSQNPNPRTGRDKLQPSASTSEWTTAPSVPFPIPPSQNPNPNPNLRPFNPTKRMRRTKRTRREKLQPSASTSVEIFEWATAPFPIPPSQNPNPNFRPFNPTNRMRRTKRTRREKLQPIASTSVEIEWTTAPSVPFPIPPDRWPTAPAVPIPIPPERLPEFVRNHNSGPPSAEDKAKVAASMVHQNAITASRQFLSNSDSKEDEREEEVVKFFLNLFEVDGELRSYYEKNCDNGEFSCLVCGGLGVKIGKKYRGCVGLVQHASSIPEQRGSHRGFRRAVFRIFGWDVSRLPNIVLDLGETLGQSLAKAAEPPNNDLCKENGISQTTEIPNHDLQKDGANDDLSCMEAKELTELTTSSNPNPELPVISIPLEKGSKKKEHEKLNQQKDGTFGVTMAGEELKESIELPSMEGAREEKEKLLEQADALDHVETREVIWLSSMDGDHVDLVQGDTSCPSTEASPGENAALLREILQVQRQQLCHAREGVQPRVGTMGDFRRLAPPTFFGTEGPTAADEWLTETEDLLDAAGVPLDDRAKMAKVQLRGIARIWWDIASEQYPLGVPWSTFRSIFLTQYFPQAARALMAQQFVTLQQESMSVQEYFAEFTRLSRYAPALVTTDEACRDKFIHGLSLELQEAVEPHSEASFHRVVEAAERQQFLRAQGSEAQKRPVDTSVRFSGARVAKRPQFTKQYQSQEQYPQRRPVGPCYHCYRMGHIESECRIVMGQCYACGSFDHTVQLCSLSRGPVPTGYGAPTTPSPLLWRPSAPDFVLQRVPAPSFGQQTRPPLPSQQQCYRQRSDPGTQGRAYVLEVEETAPASEDPIG